MAKKKRTRAKCDYVILQEHDEFCEEGPPDISGGTLTYDPMLSLARVTAEVFEDTAAALKWVRENADTLTDKHLLIVRVCREFDVKTETQTKVVLS